MYNFFTNSTNDENEKISGMHVALNSNENSLQKGIYIYGIINRCSFYISAAANPNNEITSFYVIFLSDVGSIFRC